MQGWMSETALPAATRFVIQTLPCLPLWQPRSTRLRARQAPVTAGGVPQYRTAQTTVAPSGAAAGSPSQRDGVSAPASHLSSGEESVPLSATAGATPRRPFSGARRVHADGGRGSVGAGYTAGTPGSAASTVTHPSPVGQAFTPMPPPSSSLHEGSYSNGYGGSSAATATPSSLPLP